MARKLIPNITAAELRVMKILWNATEPMAVRDVREALLASGEQPAYTTVMTMMNSLANKGALRVDKRRQPYVYTAAVRRDQVLRQRLRQFVEQVFDGQAGELVLRLVQDEELSPDELRRIEAQIEARERDDAENRHDPGHTGEDEA